MKGRLSWWKIFILLVVISSIALFFSYEHLLRPIGRFLVFGQKVQKSDVIVVLNGRDTERSLAAVDLYNGGYANLIVMGRGGKQPGSDEFWKRVGKDWNNKTLFQRSIEAMGVPEHAFKLIGDGVTGTYDEAKATKRFLEENGYKSILLVTSKWHSKRAYLTFKSTLGKDNKIEITCCPSKYDTFDPNEWWKNEDNAELVFYEYIRLTYYVITSRISPFI